MTKIQKYLFTNFIYLLLRQMAARHNVIQAVIYTGIQKLKHNKQQ